MAQMFGNTYQPSGQTYHYISNLQDTEVGWTPEEKITLESHNHDTTYPGSYCNTVVFGGVEIEVTSVLNINLKNTSFIQKIGSTVKGYEDYNVDLARPLQNQYNNATKFYNGMEFGQSVGELVPAKIKVTQTDSGTSVLWYDNNVLVNTDTMVNLFDWFALAVVVSGNTIKKYAYIFMVNGSLYTSGAKTNASVLSILNDGGYAGGGDTGRNGWTDEDLGDFIISKIYNRDGNPAYSGWVAGGRTTETITTANEDLEQRCHNYGGYLGTDVIEYITGMDNGSAWTYLTTNPASDGLSMTVPSSTPETAYYIKWNYTSQQFDIYLNETLQGSTTIYTGYHTEGSHLYITWYNQNDDISLASRFPLVWMIRTSGDYRVPQYQMYTPGLGSDLELEEFDYSTGFWDEIDGYDPESGQEDESQEDPDDIEDPSNDPLSSGFLYAFMVSKTDMIHLMEALTPETLAQKIRVDFGNNLFDFIVSYHMMPCLTNADSENKVTISYRGNAFTYGDDDTQLMLAPISKSWYRVDCGTVICQPKTTTEHPLRWDGFENWSSAQVQLYLPFIGYVHLNTADVWGQAIHIVYIFDILQGTCTANIGVGNKGTLYTFNGSCVYKIPFTSMIDKSNQEILAGVMSSLGTAVSLGSVAGGNIGGIVSGVGTGADAVGHFISAMEHKSIINRGGNLTGSPGWNAPRTPCLIITVPDLIGSPKNPPSQIYNNINGYPTYVESTLSNYTNNYVEVGQIDLVSQPNKDGAMPNDSELEMIRSLVKDGVYV